MDDLLRTIVLYAIPVVFAITVHEAAHGYVARLFGDMTATREGRVTLNPLAHIDLVGTILVPFGILLMSRLVGGPPLIFGWAKPVPVNFGALHNPKRDMLWVAAAGPASNIVMAILWAFLLRGVFEAGALPTDFWFEMALIGIQINLILMALNLFPLPPLDGGRIVYSLLPNQLAWKYGRLEPYGMAILIVLLVSGYLWPLLQPFLNLGRWIVQIFL